MNTNIELWMDLLKNDDKNVTLHLVTGKLVTGKPCSLSFVDPNLPPWVSMKFGFMEEEDKPESINLAHVTLIQKH